MGNFIHVGMQQVVVILNVFLELKLISTQSACAILYYHVFRVCPLLIFPHNLLSENNFRQEAIEYKMPFLMFYTFPFRKSDFVLHIFVFSQNTHNSCQELVECEFSPLFCKCSQLSILFQIRPMAAELFDMEGRMDRHPSWT